MNVATRRTIGLLQEGVFIGGLVLLLYATFSPAPWFNASHNLITFTPYIEPQGYTVPNQCPHQSSSGLTIPSNGPDTGEHSLRAVWMGPLGSCSRDDDGRVWCTTPSVSNPQFNFTQIPSNRVFRSGGMKGIVSTQIYIVLLVFQVVTFTCFLIVSFPWYFSRLIAHRETFFAFGVFTFFAQCLGGIGLFFATLTLHITGIDKFNRVDNFYNRAACGQLRTLKRGVLMRAGTGDGYSLAWAAWGLSSGVGLIMLFIRVKWLGSISVKDQERQVRMVLAEEKERKEREKEEERKRIEEEKKSKDDTRSVCSAATTYVGPDPPPLHV